MTNKVDISKSKLEDLVLGDKNIYPEVLHPLEKAITSIRQSISDSPDLEGIIEELAEFITDRPDREIIGVEAKLIAGGRADVVENAIYYKNKFERKLAKRQLSRVEQHVYAHVLAMIETTFNLNIRPLIVEGESKSVVDAAIHSKICEPVYKAVVGFDSSVTMHHVAGMLYFLTGKCHLVWSA